MLKISSIECATFPALLKYCSFLCATLTSLATFSFAVCAARIASFKSRSSASAFSARFVAVSARVVCSVILRWNSAISVPNNEWNMSFVIDARNSSGVAILFFGACFRYSTAAVRRSSSGVRSSVARAYNASSLSWFISTLSRSCL